MRLLTVFEETVSRNFLLRGFAALACAASVTFVCSSAMAREFFFVRVPNPVYTTNEVGISRPCITCHNNPNGGQGCIAAGGSAPCFNPFGMQFRENNFVWDSVIAARDADGDGFTNGQELQNPAGDWVEGDPMPGVPDYHTRPGFPTDSPGLHDADADRYCYFGYDNDNDGRCTSPGENNGQLDCDDRMSAVNSGATERCDNTIDDDCNGDPTIEDLMCVMVVDRDNDGFCATGHDTNRDRDCTDTGESGDPVDCDDNEVRRSPSANENCVDMIDNNCNGQVDRDDPRCMGDADNDGDGFCPTGQDLNANMRCNDSTEEIGGPSDCDDANAAIHPDATESCEDRIDNDCDGGTDYMDSTCSVRGDADMDGFCPMGRDMNNDRDCSDVGEDIAVSDCDDSRANVRPGAPEICTNMIDDDCDGDIDLGDVDPDEQGTGGIVFRGCTRYLDQDRDRYCPDGFDVDNDNDCSETREIGRGNDCDDSVATVSPATAEICNDRIDNDCNGARDAIDPVCVAQGYLDHDNDGFCGIGADTRGATDMTPDGDCDDEGEQMGPGDLAPFDPTIFPTADERCFDRKDNDQDGAIDADDTQCQGAASRMDVDDDGYCAIGRDTNDDGDCSDPGENQSVSDCDVDNAAVSPGAHENTRALCGNRRDDDCDGDVDTLDLRDHSVLSPMGPQDCGLFLDRDGDGFCPMGVNDTAPLDRDCLGEAEDRTGADCNDANPMVSARAREVCDDALDNDCDGATDLIDTQCLCMTTTPCADNDPCTIDQCTPDGQLCDHVIDPACLDPVDMGPIDMGPPDLGPPDMGPVDMGTDTTPRTAGPSGGGGCGCHVVTSGTNVRIGFVFGLVLLGARIARRRSRSGKGASR